jgi:hypothetical protein
MGVEELWEVRIYPERNFFTSFQKQTQQNRINTVIHVPWACRNNINALLVARLQYTVAYV